ncbi:calcium-activated chloride channel-domain-containing protein [Xylariales sp. PMI_506]|nr:calcium-activated chloride channel-domain-containing protein [Xylariales sp. PMI_506]
MYSSLTSYRDSYVIHYDFEDLDADTAVAEFQQLYHDLAGVGLEIDVRAGDGYSLLVFARAPEGLLASTVHKSRVKDWLFGITASQPPVDATDEVVDSAFEAEELLALYHLVSWSKADGGAAITPEFGMWKNVRSIFPIHNDATNTALLSHLSKRLYLTYEDLDRIRDLFGVKVGFYFAFMQTYLLFLCFPATIGVYAWFFLPKYSPWYALVMLVGCTTFVEYWRLQQTDLSIRWSVRGVRHAKVNRAQFQYEKITKDAAGRDVHHFPKWKSICRQLLEVPFFLGALLSLGLVITIVFFVEILIMEIYEGAYKQILTYLPTILLAVCIPYINSSLENMATWLAEYENHRTEDNYEISLGRKMFALRFIGSYLPIFLSAFVYIPFGDHITPYIGTFLRPLFISKGSLDWEQRPFHRDPDRLRNEVIALTVTGQLADMIEEMIVPYVTQQARSWYRSYQTKKMQKDMFKKIGRTETGEERMFVKNVQRQANLPSYNVYDDISEMVIQFGYLAMFSPVWPLVSVGFLINNWIELRSDFLKICIEHQRPHAVRAEGIGPWIDCLDILTLLGSISTGAIVHMFGAGFDDIEGPVGHLFGQLSTAFPWWSLPVTIFASEHIFLVMRSLVKFLLRQVGSRQVRRERDERFASRKRHWDDLVAKSGPRGALDTAQETDSDDETEDAEELGIRILKTLMHAKQKRGWADQPAN